MKKIIEKIDMKKLLIIYLLIQPIIDIITSVSVRHISASLTLGIFVRTLFMVFIVIYSLVISNKKNRTKSLIYYSLIVVFSLIYLFVCYNKFGMTMILTQIKGLIKALYLPVVLVALLNIQKEKNIQIENKFFVWTLLIYTATFFITRVFGFAYPSYEVGYKEGTNGLFYAANETGAILGILSPLLFIEFFKEFKLINILSIFLLLFSILEIGTKVPFISIIVLEILFVLVCLIKFLKKENRKKLLIKIGTSIACFLAFMLVIGYMPVGKNLQINVVQSISNKFFNNENKDGLNNDKEDEENKINMAESLSGRDLFLKDNIERYKNSSILEKLFGNGYLIINNEEIAENKTVEMDVFDIIYSLGIIGTILIFLPEVYMIILIIIKIIKNIKKVIFNEEIILLCYSIAIAYGISLLVGHVLIAPAVSIFIILDYITVKDKLVEIDTVE